VRSIVARSRRPALLLIGVVVLSTVLGVGAFAASTFYGDYGAPRTPSSIRVWQERALSYTASNCHGCHTGAAFEAASRPHAPLLCEACHLPTVDHPGPIAGVIQALPVATNADCIACHTGFPGRPENLAAIDVERHYAGATCLKCHDPHTSIAIKPLEVKHPLTNLPQCATCHAPLGLKRYPVNHEPAPDEVCLACHRVGAGGP
jgi:hypothetical protein